MDGIEYTEQMFCLDPLLGQLQLQKLIKIAMMAIQKVAEKRAGIVQS